MNYWELPPDLRKEVDLFRFKTELRVRFAETDAQGVVYNGAFLSYLDVARGEYDRNLQLWRADAPGQWWDGTHASTDIRYITSPRFDDVLTMYVRCAWMRERSSGFAYLIFNESTGALVARAETAHVA
ncbi:MAG: acyl-CoA thioesterase, partial [Candidatus Methylomirabilis sp.]|nr:acyl-CoA thioesterase [Deltaproteobacteria bacterium]